MNFLSAFSLFLCTGTVFVAAVTLDCPANLKPDGNLRHFGTHCYQFTLNHPGDWFHADSDCRGKGGYLVDIHSSSEQAFLFNSLQFLGLHGDKGVWIGLTDKDKEGTWKWTSGTNVNFRNWASGQPGSLLGGSEDCALFVFSSRGQWHDYSCKGILFTRQNHGWICKFAEVPMTTKLPSTMQQTTVSTILTTANTIQPSSGMSSKLMSSMMSSKLMSSMMSSTSTARMMSTVGMSSPVQNSAVNTMMSTSSTKSMTSSTATMQTMMSSPKMQTMLSSPTSMEMQTTTTVIDTTISPSVVKTMMSSPAMTESSPTSMEMQTTTMKSVSTT